MLMKYLFVILLVVSAQSWAQKDSLFLKAQEFAQQQRYPEAIQTMEDLRKSQPENKDYLIYLSRLYFWSEATEKSKELLDQYSSLETADKEIIDLKIQVELVLENAATVITFTDIGMSRFPEDRNQYIIWKAMGLETDDKDAEALQILSDIHKGDEDFAEADYLKTQILRKQKNTIAVGYLYTDFDQMTVDPQQLAHLEYAHKFTRFTQVGRLNYANAYGIQSLQVETDAYIRLRKFDYLYVNAGISENHTIFPLFRSGLEYYYEKRKLESSLGARYLYFDNNNEALLFTGHLALHHSEWIYNYRPFVLFLQNDPLVSHLVYFRRSFERKESYVQLDLQYGSLPYFFYTSDILTRLNAYRIGINAKIRVKENWFVQPALMYEYEEYIPDTYRNRYTVQLILSHRF